jgi:glycosyltransferase involved in cell wall biosynthesis
MSRTRTGKAMHPPDVTVVVPVFNTMPYLRRCLGSLLGQTLGLRRMEIIAVDDGSTDGGGRALDRVARRYPHTVRVLHQRNSGGPAGPCNRALDLANGRYVFFVGADDYLGPEALERLVCAGDRHGSDVVLGKVVGVNGRFVYQDVFARDETEIGLADSALPWSLTNVKLFRRELIERHRVRYPEDMPLGSDFPFTLEACYRARRVSVMADYVCYYAVRRLNARNITHLSDAEDRLRCMRRLVDFTIGLVEPGKERDAVLARLFGHEVAVLLRDDLLRLGRATQQRVYDEVRDVAQRHLNAEIEAALGIETRLRVAVARHGRLDDLLAMLRQDAERGVPPTVTEDDRWYAAYPGFRTSPQSAADDAYEVTAHLADWLAKLDATHATWRRRGDRSRVLTFTVRSPLPDLTAVCAGQIRLRVEGLSAETRPAADALSTLSADFPATELITTSAATGQRKAVQVELRLRGRRGSAPLRASGLRLPRAAIHRRGLRFYAIAATKDESGHVMISVVPITPRRIVATLRRRHAR